jgi:hypothetical protein
MKVGDLIKYRNRIPSDPPYADIGGHGVWGTIGIVIRIVNGKYIDCVDFNGDILICLIDDVEIINASG